jgi:hypothetical protein
LKNYFILINLYVLIFVPFLFPFFCVSSTARGFNKGTALSFVDVERERPAFERVRDTITRRLGQPLAIRPYEVRMDEFQGFQLRARVCALLLCILSISNF